MFSPSSLPSELQHDIVARLSWPALKALAMTCQAARAACFARVESLVWQDDKSPLPVNDLAAAFPSARRLVLGARQGSPEAFLGANRRLLAQLERMELAEDGMCFFSEAPFMAALAQHCTRLASLQLPCNFVHPGLQQQMGAALTQLTQLRMGIDSNDFDEFISDISSIRGLEDLRVSSPSVEHMSSLYSFQSLTSLQLCSAWFRYDVDFGCLGDLPSLRALRLEECRFLGWRMGAISRLTQLESLAIVDSDEEGWGYEPPISGIAAGPHPPHQPGHQRCIPG
jgi:hypothetical protein